MSVVVSVLFLVGHLVMAVFVKERVLLNNSHAVGYVALLLSENIYKSTVAYPSRLSVKSWRTCGPP